MCQNCAVNYFLAKVSLIGCQASVRPVRHSLDISHYAASLCPDLGPSDSSALFDRSH